jgi:hypothetical protein
MKKLEKKFTNKGFSFKQIIREGDIAIYEQKLLDAEKPTPRYEVIIIKSHNGYEINGTKFPPSEMYPSSTQWGKNGWTCLDMESAQKRFKKVKNSELKKQSAQKTH